VEKKVPHADLKLSWSWDRVGMEDLEFGIWGKRESFQASSGSNGERPEELRLPSIGPWRSLARG